MRTILPRLLAFMPMFIVACLVTAPAAAQECEIKIGAVGPMSGGAAAWGLGVKAGV
jgi:branched-chain amino acid transport system substrate-binding protein